MIYVVGILAYVLVLVGLSRFFHVVHEWDDEIVKMAEVPPVRAKGSRRR